jgi:hypothetical protein
VRSSRHRHLVANLLGGLLLGVGVSLLLTLFGRVSWSSTTPDLVIVGGLLLGLLLGLLPVRTTRNPAARR